MKEFFLTTIPNHHRLNPQQRGNQMQHLVGKTIQFTSKIEEMEAYPEKGMRARIVSVDEKDTHMKDLHDHMYIITFDYSEFDEFNEQFESANYYDKNSVACLTAREAKMYDVKERIYFGSPELWPLEDYFTTLDARQNELLKRFKKSRAESYVEWLESQIEV
jgi:hypothetical protein